MQVKATFNVHLEIILEEEMPESISLATIQAELMEKIKGYDFLVDIHDDQWGPASYEPKLSLKEIRLEPCG